MPFAVDGDRLLGRSIEEALPIVLSEMESNCCHQTAIVHGVCEELLGIDIPGQAGVGETHRAYVERIIEAGRPWAWSRIADRYVPGAR